jgi:SAM-dependent methyltransferase
LAGASNARPDFGPLAESYDRLRPTDDNWWELFEILVAEGDLLGRRVLDVGCGTGRLAAELARRGAKVWGVDVAPEMVARARSHAGLGVQVRQATTESLPFKDGWFERAVLRLVVHLVDRPRAFAELARVLAPGGRLVIATFDPGHFGGYWLDHLFPSLEAIDRARFAAPETIESELEEAGFADVRMRALSQPARLARDDALERIRGRFISTLQLIPQDEFERGLARAEEDLPDEIDYRLDWAVLSASVLDVVRQRS